MLSDAEDGAVLAVMDSGEITLQRTAAAGALAARHGARADAASIAVCGCGAQGRAQLAALAHLLPLKRGRVWDLDSDKAAQFARAMTAESGVTLSVAGSAAEAVAGAEVIVTCTTARAPFLRAADVAPGAFVAAVGADNPDKSELHPDVLARAVIITDVTAQCLAMGDLRHAVAAGAVRPESVHAELAEVLSGHKPGRTTPEDIVVFDSTGTAIQDVASAVWAYERASYVPGT
ncbi:MAG: hypothetical protein SFV19_09420 [Rhodospirillaceae bacterium]|nr:hypothetical protein [Rhodospirillaceae bacterium]